MAGRPFKKPCTHPLDDASELTDLSVIKDFRHGTIQTTAGYWCRRDQAFGLWTTKGRIPRRVLTGPDAPHQAPDLK